MSHPLPCDPLLPLSVCYYLFVQVGREPSTRVCVAEGRQHQHGRLACPWRPGGRMWWCTTRRPTPMVSVRLLHHSPPTNPQPSVITTHPLPMLATHKHLVPNTPSIPANHPPSHLTMHLTTQLSIQLSTSPVTTHPHTTSAYPPQTLIFCER